VTTELVHLARQGPVRTLTLDSPGNRNALSSRLLDELADGLAAAADDATVRLVVLTAAGPAFCSGADLTEGAGVVASRLPEILTAIRTAAVPVVARVNGPARAGGLGLIAAADLAVATTRCTFAFSEVRVGVAPAIILVPSLRVVADRRFLARATLTGEPFDAAAAAGAGLLTAVVDDDRALDEWVEGIADSVLKSAPGAVAATKALLAELTELHFLEGLEAARARSAELFAGAEAAEGMAAFLAKRAPAWDGATT
jgi:methylglutaconyl-CoA hydratase